MTPDEIEKDRAEGTPGPWRVGPVDDTVVIAPDGSEVAAIDGDYNEPDLWPVMEANARRIARLPELEQAYLDLTAENAALKQRIAELEMALRNIIGILDDPTGGSHVFDMRKAGMVARDAFKRIRT